MKSIVHKHSSVQGKLPTPAQLEYGEIAVNYNANDPFISVKNSNDQVVKIQGGGSKPLFTLEVQGYLFANTTAYRDFCNFIFRDKHGISECEVMVKDANVTYIPNATYKDTSVHIEWLNDTQNRKGKIDGLMSNTILSTNLPKDSDIQLLKRQITTKVDSTGLKTINGETLIGQGDIVISGGTVDAYTKEESDAKYPTKQDLKDGVTKAQAYTDKEIYKLSGSTIAHTDKLKTINNESIVGTGNISIDDSPLVMDASGNTYFKDVDNDIPDNAKNSTIIGSGNSVGNNSKIIGDNNNASLRANTVTIGNSNYNLGRDGFVIGNGNTLQSSMSPAVIIGYDNNIPQTGSRSIVIGHNIDDPLGGTSSIPFMVFGFNSVKRTEGGHVGVITFNDGNTFDNAMVVGTALKEGNGVWLRENLQINGGYLILGDTVLTEDDLTKLKQLINN